MADVEFGATVVSKGNIVVLGAVRGTVHAGATGDRSVYYGVVDETACNEDCRYCINTYISSGRNRKTKYRPS